MSRRIYMNKRRVRDLLDDLKGDGGYWDKLTEAERDRLVETLITEANGDVEHVEDGAVKRRLKRENEAYYTDVANRSVRVSLDRDDCTQDAALCDAVNNPQVRLEPIKKAAGKRKYTGAIYTADDWQTAGVSSFEDALIDAIDAEREGADYGDE